MFSAILNATDLENTHAWIGLRKINQTFVWINGLRATSETIRWAQGEPNNSGGKEDCVIVNWRKDPHNTANDFTCESLSRGLCEKPVLLDSAVPRV